MEYYFPPDYEKKMDFFNKTKFTPELKNEVLVKVEEKLKEFSYDENFYEFYKKENFDKVDPEYSHGQFYYYWLNCYLRDTLYAVWNGTYTKVRKEADDKKASKQADAAKTEMERWLKGVFQ